MVSAAADYDLDIDLLDYDSDMDPVATDDDWDMDPAQPDKDAVVSAFARFFSPRTTNMQTSSWDSSGGTRYINLFEVPCKPPQDKSLCNQFVSRARS